MTVVDYESVLYGSDDAVDDMVHVACPCSPSHCLCGIVYDEDIELEDCAIEADCVVCIGLESYPCPRCGV